MHIFVDESGSFAGFEVGSVGVVGALVIPDQKLSYLTARYGRIRHRLPQIGGEVKGRLLNEEQIAEIVSLLVRVDVVFEVTALDLGLHTADGVDAYKEAHLAGMYQRLHRFNEQT